MKKVGIYFVVAIISVAIFLLGFSYETPIQPYTAYQVYLNGELLGMIDSKQELEDYINSQGSTIKDNVQDYQKKLEIIDVVEELIKSMTEEEFVNLSTKDKVHYLIDHKTDLKISDIKMENLIKYLEDGYDNYSTEEINEIRDYVEKNEIYLFADKVYTPNGIAIKKVKTYKNAKITIPDMYLKIIEREACTIAGYRFTINDGENQKIIYVTDKAMFQEAVDTMASIFVGETEYKKFKDKTQSPIDNTGSIIEKVYLQEDITYKAVNIDTSEKIYTNTSDLAKYLLYGNEYEEYKVKVNEGDSITTLAFANEISVDEFLISNQEYTNKDNLLYPGKEVVIAKTNPQINLVVETYTVEDKVSNFATVEEYDSNMTQGNSVVTQEGETGVERVSQNVKWVNGQITYIEPVGKETIKNSVNKVVTVGTKVIPNVGSTTSWGWPTNSGYTISSPFGYRINPVTGARELHSGIDISGTGYNSPVYATNNGTIKEIQSHWSYGNYILIDHGNGYYSLYAHMAKFSPELNVGSIVERGQQIGYVGMTGTATGPHLHYEIRNCERYACVTNPLDYYQ